MFNIKELKIRRRAWVQAAGIPKARLGWVMADCTDAPKTALEPIRGWLSLALKGEYILKV